MQLAFTICSNNYLAYAATLRQSMKQHMPQLPFYLFLCDEKLESVNYATIADETIVLRQIEPEFYSLASKYNIIELNTCLKPRVFEYLFTERNVSEVIFFDPDIKIFAPFSFLFDELKHHNILLTPHICTPVPFDKKTPTENHFLNFGIFNLGFIGARKSDVTMQFLAWWKQHTYEQGYVDVYKGIFVDQLPVNFVPIFFEGVKILKDLGLNMAPWNLHERRLSKIGDSYVVHESGPLIFYHFSSLKTTETELPLSQYNRYRLSDLLVLKTVYEAYSRQLISNGNNRFSGLEIPYTDIRKLYLRNKKLKKIRDRFSLKRSARLD